MKANRGIRIKLWRKPLTRKGQNVVEYVVLFIVVLAAVFSSGLIPKSTAVFKDYFDKAKAELTNDSYTPPVVPTDCASLVTYVKNLEDQIDDANDRIAKADTQIAAIEADPDAFNELGDLTSVNASIASCEGEIATIQADYADCFDSDPTSGCTCLGWSEDDPPACIMGWDCSTCNAKQSRISALNEQLNGTTYNKWGLYAQRDFWESYEEIPGADDGSGGTHTAEDVINDLKKAKTDLQQHVIDLTNEIQGIKDANTHCVFPA